MKYRNYSTRNILLPSINASKKTSKSALDNQTPKPAKSGLVSPKYLKIKAVSKNYFENYPELKDYSENPVKKFNDSILLDNNIQDQLKFSTNLYADFQELIKPEKYNINYLCPKKSMMTPSTLHTPTPSTLPKQKYLEYKLDSMRLFKDTNCRIKKAKEYLLIAKHLSKKY